MVVINFQRRLEGVSRFGDCKEDNVTVRGREALIQSNAKEASSKAEKNALPTLRDIVLQMIDLLFMKSAVLFQQKKLRVKESQHPINQNDNCRNILFVNIYFTVQCTMCKEVMIVLWSIGFV